MKLIIKRILFYILSWTWGIIMSFIGLFPLLYCAVRGRVHHYHGRLYGTIGNGWGGISLGCFFFCSEDCQYDDLMKHECGHGLQNCVFGPLFPFLVGLPSMIRYWIFDIRERKGLTNPEYDSIWFEGSATTLGQKYILTDRL